ncbi:MAG: FeoB-associated Cys-rich membrane protein [Firmicutes bacterium]|nr:FeoB-associated Cys-rich membrane protein [Bacillota bacterium]
MEILIVLVLAVWLVIALRSIRKNGAGCGGDCTKCSGKCSKRQDR